MNFCFDFLQELLMVWEAISNIRKGVSSDIQTPWSWLKKTRLRLVFSTTSRCLDIGWNTLPHVWYITWTIFFNTVETHFIAKPDSWIIAWHLYTLVFTFSEDQNINFTQINYFVRQTFMLYLCCMNEHSLPYVYNVR